MPRQETASAPSFGATQVGFVDDAFEAFAQLRSRHPVLPDEEAVKLLRMAAGDDPELADMAMDRLVRHNVGHILRAVRKWGGHGADRRGHQRDDLLAAARMGFIEALRRFDIEAADRDGNHVQLFLKYTDVWMRKRVGALSKRERFGLNPEQALLRRRVFRAEQRFKKDHGRTPSDEELADALKEAARAEIEAQGLEVTPRRIQERGGVIVDVVRALRTHDISRRSLDDPIGEDEGMSIGDVVADEGSTPDQNLAADEVARGLAARLDMIPGRKERLLSRVINGMPTEDGEGRHDRLMPAEAGNLIGRSVDTVHAYLQRVQHGLKGEELVDPKTLHSDAFPYSMATLAAMRDVPSEVRDLLRGQVELAPVLMADGVLLDPRDPARPAPCPFDDCEADDRTFSVSDGGFSCGSCGREGELIEWLEQGRGLSPKKAREEAARLALGLPAELPEVGGKVAVIRDPERRESLRRLAQ